MLIFLNVILFLVIYSTLYFSLRNTIVGTFTLFSYVFLPFELLEVNKLNKVNK